MPQESGNEICSLLVGGLMINSGDAGQPGPGEREEQGDGGSTPADDTVQQVYESGLQHMTQSNRYLGLDCSR